MSAELIRAGALALVLAIAAMLVYIWFRFEWQFSVGAVAALVHDVVLTIGLFSLTRLDFNLATIAAILTIIGYSMNDTVVIYDRVRENLRKYKTMNLAQLLDRSVNDTLSRTVVTSVTTLLALAALRFIGGEVIESFTVAMMWGVVVGTYSSVFIARAAAHLPEGGHRHRARGRHRRGPGRRGLIAPRGFSAWRSRNSSAAAAARSSSLRRRRLSHLGPGVDGLGGGVPRPHARVVRGLRRGG